MAEPNKFTSQPESGDYHNSAEAFRELVNYVEDALHIAARGDPEAKKLLQDREFLKTILALIDYKDKRGVRVFQEGQFDIEEDPAFLKRFIYWLGEEGAEFDFSGAGL